MYTKIENMRRTGKGGYKSPHTTFYSAVISNLLCVLSLWYK